MNLAKDLDAADTYVELSRKDSKPQLDKLKADNPYGFDIGECGNNKLPRIITDTKASVIEATGSVKLLEDAINYCRRGGTLVVYGYICSPLAS